MGIDENILFFCRNREFRYEDVEAEALEPLVNLSTEIESARQRINRCVMLKKLLSGQPVTKRIQQFLDEYDRIIQMSKNDLERWKR